MDFPTDDLIKPRIPAPDEDAEGIVAGDIARLRGAFAARGADGPVIRWAPSLVDLDPAPLRFLLGHWRALKGNELLPHKDRIDALDLAPALGHIALVDVLGAGEEFRYRLFGSLIAETSGFDMTGRVLSSHEASSYVIDFFRASYRAVVLRPEPLHTVHSPPSAISTTVWHRLILPFGDSAAQVDRLLIGIVPVKRLAPRST